MADKQSYMTELDLDSIVLPEKAKRAAKPREPVQYELALDDDDFVNETIANASKDDSDNDNESATNVEIVDDTPPKDKNRKPLGEDPDDIPDDELSEYSARVKERISKLRHGYHDERRSKEAANREKEEALKLAKAIYEENQNLKKQYAEGEKLFGQTLQTASQSQLEAAKRKVKDAYESGDSDALVQAQEELAEAKFRAVQSQSFQPQQQALQERDFDEQWAQHAQRAQPPQAQPDEMAVRWQQRNPWFGADDEMTSFAFGVHKRLVESGVDPRTPEYYERIDARLRQVFPSKFEDAEDRQTQQTKLPGTVVAAQTRSTRPKKIVLTKSQQAVARRLGVAPEEYARQVALLQDKN